MTTKEFNLSKFDSQRELRVKIQGCQYDNHIQQVAYSTYEDCLTQICFTCKTIRTTLKENKTK